MHPLTSLPLLVRTVLVRTAVLKEQLLSEYFLSASPHWKQEIFSWYLIWKIDCVPGSKNYYILGTPIWLDPIGFFLSELFTVNLQQFINYISGAPTQALVPVGISHPEFLLLSVYLDNLKFSVYSKRIYRFVVRINVRVCHFNEYKIDEMTTAILCMNKRKYN